jgi:hypothetical protein
MFFSPETKLGSEIMPKILNFAPFEAKKFSPSFRLEAKNTKLKRSEKFKAKNSEKNKKNRKQNKKSQKKQKKWKIDLNFASLRFALKRKLLKRSKAKNLKQKEAKKDK